MMPLSKPVTLRPAMPADWPEIATLLRTNDLPLDGAWAHLDRSLLAIVDGGIAGNAGTERYGAIALVRSVAVVPGLHGQGIGKLLLERLIELARQDGIARLYLLTVTAPEYFTRFGFERASREEAPEALSASAEFNGACPASAVFMTRAL